MLTIIHVDTIPQLVDCIRLRIEIFVLEQQVDIAEELDSYDRSADHFIVYDEDIPVATCRALMEGNDAKIGRFCVKQPYRKKHIGLQLLSFVESYLHNLQGINRFYLGAQVSAIPFYEKSGYSSFGDFFIDATINHRWMEKFWNSKAKNDG